jgi:hypothetical protein
MEASLISKNAVFVLLLTVAILSAAATETYALKPVFGASTQEQEQEPRIFSVGTTSFSSRLTTGQSANFKIEGRGDLTHCIVELAVEGHVTNAGVKNVAMKGQTVYVEPFTVAFPDGYPKNTYSLLSMVLTPVSGCRLIGGGRDNILRATFPLWSGPLD